MKSSILSVLSLVIAIVYADVAHFFAPEFGSFFQHHIPQHVIQHQQEQFAFQYPLQPPNDGLSSVYGPPPQEQPAFGYPNPIAPTPAPVAPSAIPSTTEFTLPEVIDNRSAKTRSQFIPLSNEYLPPNERPNYESPPQPPQVGFDNNGYYYPRPTASTTTTTAAPSAIIVQEPLEPEVPFNFDPNPSSPPGYDYNAPSPVVIAHPERPSTPAPVYLPSLPSGSIEESSAAAATPPLRLRIQEMRCLQHTDGYFRAVLKVNSFISAIPIVDNDAFDKHCELKLMRSYVVADIAAADFKKCGVRACGKDLCLRLRFPTIRNMRTSTDAILTLHCKTQERVAAKTHALKMSTAYDVQARSIGTYAHGGTQNQFRTHVELLRKTNNGFTRHLETNNAVQLGEELLLRAHILAGDGWNHTKLTDVSLQRISPSGELINAANLINTRGCVNPSMQSICAHAPTYDPPLGHKLAFKAVMFQGMRSGEELVLSMRITGCLDPHDCHVNAGDCNSNVRRRRAIGGKDINSTEVSEISQIAFRVVMPMDKVKLQDNMLDISDDELPETVPRAWVVMGSIGFVVLLLALGICATLKLRF